MWSNTDSTISEVIPEVHRHVCLPAQPYLLDRRRLHTGHRRSAPGATSGQELLLLSVKAEKGMDHGQGSLLPTSALFKAKEQGTSKGVSANCKHEVFRAAEV